jgi:hypothetical protein
MLHVETTKSIHIPPDQASKPEGSNQAPAQVSKDTLHQLKEGATDSAGCQSKQALTGIPV